MALFFAGSLVTLFRKWKSTVSLDAFGQPVDVALLKAPGRKLHQLYVLNPFDSYTKQAE